MAGKKIRSRTSQSSIKISKLYSETSNNNNNNNNNRKNDNNNLIIMGGGNSNNSRPGDVQLLNMTKEQLKSECRKRGQKTNGNKIELLQRLGVKMAASKKKESTIATVATTSQSTSSTLTNNSTTTNNSSNSNSTTIGTTNGTATLIGDGNNSQKNQERIRKEKEKSERQQLVLWRRPITTVEYSAKEVVILLTTYGRKVLVYRKLVSLVLISVLASYLLVNTSGPHHKLVQNVYKKVLWCLYWIGLGILSSVGLGTGLHTFLLYLGPHIAQVTLAAYECESLNFPEPPYPDEIICPEVRNPLAVTIFTIMSKVRLEAMCWGAGTALGELPPYFMARAARLSGIDPDDEDDDLKEFEELQRKQNRPSELTIIEKGKLFVEELVQKVGFLGILACASIPNPLFDLAGITCGHFLVPFWTFFGATLIGKAIIKMHIQKLFVIIAFNETLIITALQWLKYIPIIGERLQTPFKAFLDSQKLKLHKNASKSNTKLKEGGNILGLLFECFVFAMILYFVISIINSFAQNYHKRIHKRKSSKIAKD